MSTSNLSCATNTRFAAPSTNRPIPSANKPPSYSAFNSFALSTGTSHYVGDAQYKTQHPNALCVTSSPGSNLPEKCMMAFNEQTGGQSTCSYSKGYMVNADSVIGGKIPSCATTKDPKAVCIPANTTAVLCDPDTLQVGLNVGPNMGSQGNQQMVPQYIAVPTSEYTNDVLNSYGTCISPDPKATTDKFGYVKTSNFQHGQYSFSGRLGAGF